MTKADGAGTRKRRSALDMPADEFRSVGRALVDRIADFYESLPERRVTPAEQPGDLQSLIGPGELPERGESADKLLAETAPLLFDHSLHNGHPRFFGYITSSAAPLGALADLMAAAVNANIAKWDLSPVASEIETQTIRWIADLIGYDTQCDGLMVSGGNMSNFLAFVAARTAKIPWDIRRLGNRGGEQRPTVYVSAETHTWIEKATDVCGLGTDSIRWIETDSDGRLRPDLLRQRIEADRADGCLPFLVVGTAGTTALGAIDPLRDLAAICREFDLWFHIDGAYGAPAACLPEAPEELHHLDIADSITIDPHKWLYCPIEAACVLTRHESALRDAFAFHPDYYPVDDTESAGTNFFELGMQNTRGFKALKVWLALQQAGREGIRETIRGDIRLAETLHAILERHEEFEVHSINLSIVNFRYVPGDLRADDPGVSAYLDVLNEALLRDIRNGGEVFLSNSIVDGSYLLRACIVNFRTMLEDVEAIPEIVAEMGKKLDRSLRPAHLVA